MYKNRQYNEQVRVRIFAFETVLVSPANVRK